MATRTFGNIRENPNKLYVLFAEDGSILSLEDDNDITINNTLVTTLNAGDRYDLSVTEGMVIEGTGSFLGAGEVGSSHFSYLPEYCKGRLLQTTILRDNPTEIKIYPFANGSVDILVNNVLQTTLTLSQGVVSTYTNNANGAWRLNSTVQILAQIRTGTSDPHIMLWGNHTKVGFSSNSGILSTLLEEGNVSGTVHAFNNNVNFTEDSINSASIVPSGTRSYENPESSSHAVTNGRYRVFGHSYADSDGNTSATWLPTTLMYHTVGLPHGTEFVSFINRTGRPIRKYQGGSLVATLTPTKVNTSPLAFYSVRDGIINSTINITDGTIYTCDEKMYAVYQNRESTIFASLDDETTLLPTQLNYKYIP